MTRILVTGVGGGVGQSLVKSFQNSSYTVIGADGEPWATGLYATRTSYLIPYASDPNYITRIEEICQVEQCALLFPGLDAELPVLSRNRKRLAERGVTPVV